MIEVNSFFQSFQIPQYWDDKCKKQIIVALKSRMNEGDAYNIYKLSTQSMHGRANK